MFVLDYPGIGKVFHVMGSGAYPWGAVCVKIRMCIRLPQKPPHLRNCDPLFINPPRHL